jgi:hemerythrin superfamily protein
VPTDPLGILRADHRRIERCFTRYHRSNDESQWPAIVQEMVQAISRHLDIEEKIFYPAFFQATEDPARQRRLLRDRTAQRKLLADIACADPGDDALEHSIAALERRTLAHIHEEESASGIFQEIGGAGVDLSDLRRRLQHYRDNDIAATLQGAVRMRA